MSRYDVPDSEGAAQPGSGGSVLRNRAGITDPAVMEDLELGLLAYLYRHVLGDGFPGQRRLQVADILDWHHRWLGNVYDWAGQLRTVNMSKGNFHFAAARQLPRLLEGFQAECLYRWTPADVVPAGDLARVLAVTHVELILIHPFREGNGRIARLLSDVMAVQAGRGLLDYSSWELRREQYFAAVRQGMGRDYDAMEALMRLALCGT